MISLGLGPHPLADHMPEGDFFWDLTWLTVFEKARCVSRGLPFAGLVVKRIMAPICTPLGRRGSYTKPKELGSAFCRKALARAAVARPILYHGPPCCLRLLQIRHTLIIPIPCINPFGSGSLNYFNLPPKFRFGFCTTYPSQKHTTSRQTRKNAIKHRLNGQYTFGVQVHHTKDSGLAHLGLARIFKPSVSRKDCKLRLVSD